MLSPGRNNINRNIALLGAFCLFLSAVEYLIPKPLPFMRIGLANLPLMLALDILPFPSFLVLICIKVIGQGLITGTLFSYVFLFSLTGTFLSALVMFALRRVFGCNRITFIGIGTAGAFISNVSQLALAYMFIFKENARYIAPPFLAVGIVTGVVLGVFCEAFIRNSRWYRAESKDQREERENKVEKNTLKNVQKAELKNNFYENNFSAYALFIVGILIIPALLFNPSTEFRIIQFLFFWILALINGKKTNPLITILIIVIIITFNLIIPYGRVLFSAGVFKITSGALTAGVHRAFTLAALVMLSKVTIRQDLKIPGAFGEVLGESLRLFSLIMSRKYRLKRANFLTELDNLLLELSEEKLSQSVVHAMRTKPAGYLVLVIVIVLSWLPWVF